MKNLIFIPYQDIYDLNESRIFTREYSILYFLRKINKGKLVCVNKPRTFIDKKKMMSQVFESDSVEECINHDIKISTHLQYVTPLTLSLFTKRRGWWVEGYQKSIKFFKNLDIDWSNTVVYSNNPYAVRLLEYLRNKNSIIIFDMMDNISLHPSFSEVEKKIAYDCYSEVSKFANFFSCNSQNSVEFCEQNYFFTPTLMKNGVFEKRLSQATDIKQADIIIKTKENFETTAGYIGKLGMRIDEKLVKSLLENCPNVLFVFLGPMLKGQKNNKLVELLNSNVNALLLNAIPSIQIYNYLELFDVLLIPHAVGKNENGGDPLKLYQYLNTGKPIITTPINGVDEFQSIISVESDYNLWCNYFNKHLYKEEHSYAIPKEITWEYRLSPLLNYMKKGVLK